MANYLTLTVIFNGSNLNYGESTANITSLKKLSFKGKSYSYISRQALRYDIVRIMNEEFGIALTPVGSDGKVVQFEANTTIEKYPEIDLFGYMKTSGEGSRGRIRKAIVRLSDAISLEPWNSDIDYGNNMGLSARREGLDNMIFQTEIHKSFYTYTITIDLDKVGIDTNDDITLNSNERKKRVCLLLDAIKVLYRDIKGRREELSPVFVIGGVYNTGNPFFYNKVSLEFGTNSTKIKTEPINEILERNYNDQEVKENTYIGHLNGTFDNLEDINLEKNKITSIESFFNALKNALDEVYK
ncbi:type I-B CRISPR-associated protein Cas7/Cst2/DevR [Spirochaetia bacterium 38H-sp]|uniref:Type I-B CRISPR-associated protein Cas7/Cst2/DevR n=1 Tax=Rarispira pelagica TaxID=3141764 RepID=A0ABU9UBD0_9SPIR